MDIALLKPLALKVWAIKKYEEFEKTLHRKWALEAQALLEEVMDEQPDTVQRWPAAVNERLNYLMARQPIIKGKDKKGQDELDGIMDDIRALATRWLCAGQAIWLVQGDGVTPAVKPELMDDMLVIYEDKKKEKPICRVRKIVEVEIDPRTGAESTYDLYEVFRGNVKYTFDKARPRKDKEEVFTTAPLWIEIGVTGAKSVYATVRGILMSLNKVYANQDATVVANTRPLIEIRGYSGTDLFEAREAVEGAGVVLTEGEGGITVHARSMDSTGMEIWRKGLLQQFYEGTGTVGKDRELEFAVSGKALDRLFVQAENAAVELGNLLSVAIIELLKKQGIEGEPEIEWNTDRPVDDTAIIDNVIKLRNAQLMSVETALEMLPWVDNVKDEEARIQKEKTSGIESLFASPSIARPGGSTNMQ